MEMNGFSTLSIALGLELYHQMVLCHSQDSCLVGEVSPLQICIQRILENQTIRIRRIRKMKDNTSQILLIILIEGARRIRKMKDNTSQILLIILIEGARRIRKMKDNTSQILLIILIEGARRIRKMKDNTSQILLI